MALPEDCEKGLECPPKWRTKTFLGRLFPKMANRASYLVLYQNLLEYLERQEGESILFFESFNTFYLYALAQILKKRKRPFHLWILYRAEPHQIFFKGKREKGLIKKLEHLLEKRVRFFCDTELLKASWESFLKRPVTLLPIPHTEKKEETFIERKEFILYWPGIPRRPKGLAYIQEMVKTP